MTTNEIIAELRSPSNFVEVEWNRPENLTEVERAQITAEAETYRKVASEDEVEEVWDQLKHEDTPLAAASLFLDLTADHGEYNTVSVTLKAKP
jgi:hypothetical protein